MGAGLNLRKRRLGTPLIYWLGLNIYEVIYDGPVLKSRSELETVSFYSETIQPITGSDSFSSAHQSILTGSWTSL